VYEPLKKVGLFKTSAHSTSSAVKDKSLLNPDKLTLAWLVATHVGLPDMSDHEDAPPCPSVPSLPGSPLRSSMLGLSVKSLNDPVKKVGLLVTLTHAIVPGSSSPKSLLFLKVDNTLTGAHPLRLSRQIGVRAAE
jgi:hypothetical protein